MNTLNVKPGGNAPAAKRPVIGKKAKKGTSYTGRSVSGGIPIRKVGTTFKGKVRHNHSEFL